MAGQQAPDLRVKLHPEPKSVKPVIFAPLLALTALSACVAPTGPVEVTRFHALNISALGKGAIAVEPAAGMDAAALEFKSFEGAVMGQLQRLGFAEAAAGASSDHVALVRLSRARLRPDRSVGPVSVGIGGRPSARCCPWAILHDPLRTREMA